MDDTLQYEFREGVEAYWAGELPEGWEDEKRRNVTPYLMGWWMASNWEVNAGTLLDRDGDPLQDDDE